MTYYPKNLIYSDDSGGNRGQMHGQFTISFLFNLISATPQR